MSAGKTRYSTALLAGTTVLVGILGTLMFLEIVLQILPVRNGLNVQPVSREQPVFRFAPNREATFSKNWNLALANRVHTNNDGFVNLQSYDAKATTPLLAIIGDSYIEAAMVPEKETVHARLQVHYGKARRVYSFAASGAGLAQYLSWARYARDTYRPDRVLFNIISNDFSEALWARERNPGFHGFKRDAAKGWSLELAPFTPGGWRTLGRRSALIRYLVLNLQVTDFMRNGFFAGADERRWAGNVAAEVDDEFFQDALWAARVFLDEAPASTGLPRDKIALSIDAIRPDLYEGRMRVPDSFWERIRKAFIAEARSRGYEVIDLQEAFANDYARNKRRFEFELDSHWNGEGHRVLAEQVAASATMKR